MTSRRDDATARLTTLLDRLAEELLGAPDPEMEAALRETGRARTAALHEVRALLTPSMSAGVPDKVGRITGAAPSATLNNRH